MDFRNQNIRLQFWQNAGVISICWTAAIRIQCSLANEMCILHHYKIRFVLLCTLNIVGVSYFYK